MTYPIGQFPNTRMRRRRGNANIRQLIRETALTCQDLILPLFIHAGSNIQNPIQSMPGHAQWSLDKLPIEIDQIRSLGLGGVILFGIPEHKDAEGSDAHSEQGIIAQAVRQIKQRAPELLVIADVCYCEYTSHGHCGVLTEGNDVDNDKTLALLSRQAVVLAQAGADIIAPSGMMDGMVGAIRQALDNNHFQQIPILSYAVKYSSAFYGPFREAAQGAPQFGDRKSYQMDPANSNEALQEAALDIAEGADFLMVKPAMAYLDIIAKLKQTYPSMPLAAYQVSGEYAMLHAAAEKGWLDLPSTAMESLLAIKRAGADFIISYFAKQVAHWQNAL